MLPAASSHTMLIERQFWTNASDNRDLAGQDEADGPQNSPLQELASTLSAAHGVLTPDQNGSVSGEAASGRPSVPNGESKVVVSIKPYPLLLASTIVMQSCCLCGDLLSCASERCRLSLEG